jgi:lysophospholipase L1-like esterase
MIQSVLCFGDSNTWGYNPKDGSRYPSDIRWTGVLQRLIGPGFHVIEEGLNGRTTTINEIERPMRSAKDILPVLLESHRPLSHIILMIGTNDLKTHFQRTAQNIAEDLADLCALIVAHPMLVEQRPKLILAAPTGPDEACDQLPEWFKNTHEKWRTLLKLLPEAAQNHGAEYLATETIMDMKFQDGLHWSEKQHEDFAAAVLDLV